MKTKLSLMAALLFSAGLSVAQTTTTTTTTTTAAAEPSDIHVVKGESGDLKHGYIGARGLATFTHFRLKTIDDHTISTDFTAGWGAGGVLGANLSRHVGVQLEVLYSDLSQKFKDNNFERTLKVTYVNVPLLLVLNTGVTKGVNLNICGGPQVGINTGSSISHEPTTPEGAENVHAVLSVKQGDFGFAFGTGLDFKMCEALRLNIGYRGVAGLVDISDNSKNLATKDYYILDRSHVNTHSAYAGLTLMF